MDARDQWKARAHIPLGGGTLPISTPIPRPEALELVTRCAHLVQEHFGAKRVIPFGSVVGHGTWHSGSDLDLAVEGVAPEHFFRAWSMLREMLPPGPEVDLVDLEQAGEALRARILGEKAMSEDSFLALKELIEDELAALDRVVHAMQEGLPPLLSGVPSFLSPCVWLYAGMGQAPSFSGGHGSNTHRVAKPADSVPWRLVS